MTTGEAILTVQGLNVSYGEAKVLFDMDLSVGSRQIVACVGRNGAGKSTLRPTQATICREPTLKFMSNSTFASP